MSRQPYQQRVIDEKNALDANITKLEAEIHASDLAVAEYRQQCLDNAQEIARLRAESEERLQNCAALVAENERLRKDAERYQFIRDADRSDCIWREICIYAMETLDEYVDAAMDGEKAMKGTP